MYSTMIRTFAIATCTIAAASMASAQQSGPAKHDFDLGKYEYDGHCAVCHGVSGKGDGPFRDLQSGPIMPNLTHLSKKNNGVFPFIRVYEIIDGTQAIRAHGTREMPIWGLRYEIEAKETIYDDFWSDPVVFVRGRILALTEYIYRLQVR